MASGAAIFEVFAPPAIGHALSCCGWIPSCTSGERSISNAIFPSFVLTLRAYSRFSLWSLPEILIIAMKIMAFGGEAADFLFANIK
ncbi:hypothetical protein [Brucella anthropi]|uniref:hypothetical protein n=1 Tax=Brucella anthropi TaxID=529 RepID=UPI0011BE75E3|nr:hypothetical protein [Brucella anthropi]